MISKQRVFLGTLAVAGVLLALVGATQAGPSNQEASATTAVGSRVRAAEEVRPPIHKLQGGVRVSEKQMTFLDAMKTVGITPENANFDMFATGKDAPVYLTVTQYTGPFSVAGRAYPAGTVTTITDAVTGEVIFASAPGALDRSPIQEHR